MANIVNLPHVLILDTTADNIVASTTQVRVRKLRLVAGAAAAATAVIGEAGFTTARLNLQALQGTTDTLEFYAKPFDLAGLKATLSGAGALLYVYTESA